MSCLLLVGCVSPGRAEASPWEVPPSPPSSLLFPSPCLAHLLWGTHPCLTMQHGLSAAQTSPLGWLEAIQIRDVGYIHSHHTFPSLTRELLVGPCNLQFPGMGHGTCSPRDVQGMWHFPAGHRDVADQLF